MGNFNRLPDPAEWNEMFLLLQSVGDTRLRMNVCLDKAGSHGVHPNALFGYLFCQTDSESSSRLYRFG